MSDEPKIKVRRRPTGQEPVDVIDLDARQKVEAWRGECPSCNAPLVAMSELVPSLPSKLPPNRGDAIRCAACGHYALVDGVEDTPDHGRRMRLHKIEVPQA